MMLKNLTLFIFTVFFIKLSSQTIVNTEWEILYGTPDEVEWSASGTDNSNNLLETGNTIVTNEGANIITTKKDKSGQVLWEKLFDGTDSSNDYGIAVKSDNANNVYVAGATNDLTDDAFDFIILKYNPSGTLQWEYTYAGNFNGNDLPIGILPDGSGNVYVTGLSEDSTEQDILTLKLSSTGALVWEARYDHAQLPDIPAGIEFDDFGNLIVAGGSADTAKWEIVTLKYSPSGTLLNETRVPSTTFEQPRAFTKDGQGNFYITGQTGTGGSNPDVKTIKLDSALNIVWEQEHDGTGFEDMGNSLCVNNEGDIFITGYSRNSDGSQDMLTLRYKPDGTKVWAKTIRPLYPQGTAAGRKITADGFGRIYVAGETQLNSNPDMVVIGYDTSGLKRWHRIFSNGPTGVEVPTGITIDLLGDILVTGISKDGASSKNFTVKYSPYERYRSVELDSSGTPLYWKRQVIAGFGHDKVLKDNIDQKEKLYGKPGYFLDSSCVTQLYGKLGKVLDGTKFVKAFPTLDTDCKETTGRHGNTVPIPPFWSTFVLDLPPGADAVPLVDSLRCLFPTVRYAHLNYAGDIASNDPLFDQQASLHPISGLEEGHINVEPAWDVTVGDETIRVGVFDSGVEWRHEDYRWNQFSQLSSVVAAGWDFGFGVDMRDETLSNPDYKPDPQAGGHGTNVAGIIGAVRNNSKGVAGIAGGDKGGGIKGTTLYSLRVLVQSSDPVINGYTDLSYIADAIVKSALRDTPCDTTYSYGLDIQNHSYGFSINQAAISNESIDVLKDAVHLANRGNVIIVAASGNNPNTNQAPPDYPASLNDDWVIKVGGSGTELVYGYPAQIGGIDVVAPNHESLTKSTLNILHQYSNFSGTSCSAPHVSGTAALMLANSGGMGPDDVERVLELTADDIDRAPAAQGVDEYTGYGRINACRALRAVDLHDFQYIGPDSLAVNFSAANPPQVRLELIDDYENSNSDVFGPGMYDANVYKVDAVAANGLPVAANIIEAWPRVSYSNLFAAYTNDPVTDSNFLDPVEDILLNSYTQDSAYLEGYIYEMFDTNGVAMGWIPFPLDSLQDRAKVAYTIMTGPGIGGAGDACDLINSTSVVLGEGYSLEAFPNPTTGKVNLLVRFEQFFETIEIDLFNANGALIKSVYSGKGQGKELLLTDYVDYLPPGMYFYVAATETGKIAQRIIKL